MAYNATQVIETFDAAKEENVLSVARVEQVVHLPEEGEVWMTGDIHDNRTNFNKLIAAADLENNPQRHLILHELIHGDRFDPKGNDGSWETLYKAAELKCDFPEQVHFMLANHDLAQVLGEGIVKGGISVCEAFTGGIKRDFGNEHGGVNVAITEFLLSLPLGIRCPNGLFFCHSLPTDKQIDSFDYTVFNRPVTGADYVRKTGPAYQLVWGRNFSPETVEKFATKIEADIIITGHQPQENGYLVNGPRHLIIASDHSQGVFLPVNLAEKYTIDDLVARLVKFVSIDA